MIIALNVHTITYIILYLYRLAVCSENAYYDVFLIFVSRWCNFIIIHQFVLPQ